MPQPRREDQPCSGKAALMLDQPPADCRDRRLWLAAHDLAVQHAPQAGRCPVCVTPAPCRIAEAAEEAKRRALPPPPPVVSTAPAPPLPPPPVGARFPRTRPEGAGRPPDPAAAGWAPPASPPVPPQQPVGARFPREARVGRRRRPG